jgi:hypothetical protein
MIKHTYKPDLILWEPKTFSDDRAVLERVFCKSTIDFARDPSKQYTHVLTTDLRLIGPGT